MTEAHEEKPNANFYHRENSPTAANATDKKFGPSGAMAFEVMVATGMGLIPHEVVASTGDEAAELTLARFPGARVASVNPAPKARPTLGVPSRTQDEA